jgi:hypothetical protein
MATALLVFLGRVVGTASHRRPPNPLAARVVSVLFVTIAVEVAAMGFSPNWSVALSAWYLALALTGVLLNRWCEAPERYAVFVATFVVVVTSLILMVISAASPMAPADLTSKSVLVSLWPNVTRIASHPGDAAWTWLAWRLADRLRTPEARRPKARGQLAVKIPKPKRPA